MQQKENKNKLVNNLGFWCASVLLTLGIVYAIILTFGIISTDSDKPITDPILGIMEIITLISAPILIIMMVSIHYVTDQSKQILTFIGVCFTLLMAGLTSGVHFVALTAGRQMGLPELHWPSVDYAIELLSWDVFLGFALVFTALVFQGTKTAKRVKYSMLLTGMLCLAGSIGPFTGKMNLQYFGIIGYAVFLPLTSYFLAVFFNKLQNSVKIFRQN